MELSSKLKSMKFMKRKEVSSEVKQKEEEQLNLANVTHWVAPQTSTVDPSKLK